MLEEWIIFFYIIWSGEIYILDVDVIIFIFWIELWNRINSSSIV